MKLKKYLKTIHKLLELPSKQKNKIILEIEEHINDEQRKMMLNGTAEIKSQVMAIEKFGKPHLAAKRFNKVYQSRWNSFKKLIIASLIAYFMSRFIFTWSVAVFLDYFNIDAFVYYLGPGYHDKLYSFIGLFLLIFLVMSLAYWMNYHLQKIIINHYKLKFYYFIFTISLTLFHFLYSFIKFIIAYIYKGTLPLPNLINILASWETLVPQMYIYYIFINFLYMISTSIIIMISLGLFFTFLYRKNIKFKKVLA